MLAYLAVRLEARRDELVALLWGDIDETRARNAFRQALHRLRSGLGENAIPQSREALTLSQNALWCDRSAFIDAVRSGRAEAAADLYAGDFAEGLELGETSFDAWLDAERARLRGDAQWALRAAAERALEAGRTLDAQRYCDRLRVLAPYDDDAALLHASILVAAGRQSEATDALRQFTRRIADDLAVEPRDDVRRMLVRLERVTQSADRGATVKHSDDGARTTRIRELRLPFVGREAEISRLMGLVRDLGAEHGAMAVIEGPSGIGKTRLVEEFLERAQSLGKLVVLRGSERSAGTSVPYAGMGQALRLAVRAPGVSGASRHLLSEAARLVPELRDTFELPEPGPIADDASRLRFFEGIAALLDAIAYEVPVCVVIDDLQNAASLSIDLLGYLADRLASSPVLIVALYRNDGRADSVLDRLRVLAERCAKAPNGVRLELQPLGDADCAVLVRHALPSFGDAHIDVDHVVANGGGNPLRVLQVAGALARGETVAALPVPMRDILLARLRTGTPIERRVFFAAALLGRPAPVRLIAAAAHLGEVASLDALASLATKVLVKSAADGFTLADDSTHDCVLELAGPAGRALLAGWAADALVSESSGSAADVAHLYAMAGRSAETCAWARRAAMDAARIGALADADRHLTIALTIATDDATRAELQSLRTAFGSGDRRLIGAAGIASASDTNIAGANAAAVPARATTIPWRLAALLLLLVIASAVLVTGRLRQLRPPGMRLSDTVVVVEHGRERARAMALTGALTDKPLAPSAEVRKTIGPDWIDSLPLPWINPLASPDGRWVALERMTRTGTDLYAMSSSRRDTVPLALGGGDDIAMGWSPDGQMLLVSRARILADGRYDSDLFAYAPGTSRGPQPIDTSEQRSIAEAQWSPDGSHIAWVARAGADRQQDVYVSNADGSGARNLTHNAAEDYHISWSNDGSLISFTSDRSGRAELYAIDIADGHLWQLTRDEAHADHAAFSPGGSQIAFESTRAGDAAVYVMPALGGVAHRLTPAGREFAFAGWRGAQAPYLDRLRIVGQSAVALGDSVSLSVLGIDQHGREFAVNGVRWTLLDSGLARMTPAADTGVVRRVIALRRGSPRIVAAVPGWRADTLVLQTGDDARVLLSDDFASSVSADRWISLGDPPPVSRASTAGTGVLMPRADLEWESGILSRQTLPVRPGTVVNVQFRAPFSSSTLQPATLEASLVLPVDERHIDRAAPQLSNVVSVAWSAQSRRFVYTVDRETRTEPLSAFGDADHHEMTIVVEQDGRVSFTVDGRLRWHSSQRLVSDGREQNLQLWLGGRATTDAASFGPVRVWNRRR